jgi:hypothetical protein
MVEGSMPFEARTSSRGLAAPKGLDLPLLCSAVDATAPEDLGFNYEVMKEEISSEDADEYQGYLRRLMKNCFVICRRSEKLEKIICSVQIQNVSLPG